MSFTVGSTIYNTGLPLFKELPTLFKTALIISLAMSVITSHSHIHYLGLLTQLAK